MKTTTNIPNRFVKMKAAAFAAVAIAALASTPARAFDTDKDGDDFKFDLVRSKALAPNVAPHAHGRVNIESLGPVEIMKVKIWGLPPNSDFDLFVIQAPNLPFGLAWYQGDIMTNKQGEGYGEFIGRFNIESFIVAPGVVAAPSDPFNDPKRIPDATQNPATNPVQLYHLGLWFDSPQDAKNAGAPEIFTPFNGTHDAGVQVLNSGEFADTDGPLKRVTTSGN